MNQPIKLRKGLTIRLKGEADKVIALNFSSKCYAVKPPDFIGITPKLLIKEGDLVNAGTPLFHAKHNEKILFTAPVSGKIAMIERGEKRIIQQIIIEADAETNYLDFPKYKPEELTREQIIDLLCKSGTFPYIRQRPYHCIANPAEIPKAIFISGFNTAPLAPDIDFMVHGKGEYFQTGINALCKLTNGTVHLNLLADNINSKVLSNTKGVQFNYFKGRHPAGNTGVQMHHIDPLNKGEVAWFIHPQDVIIIGKLFKDGRYDACKLVALTGSEISNPKYYKIINGASIEKMLEKNTSNKELRCISGNVLTGTKIEKNGFVSFYDDQITIIPEGKKHEFLGWAMPGFNKFSLSKTYFSWLMPAKKYTINTNFHGGERAFVLTGQYEKVLPMDILPMHLLKAIITEDIDMMEKLGIYEVAEEDFALCEFICPSKIEIQEIIRKGLDLIKKEMS